MLDSDNRILGIVNPPAVLGWRRAGKHRLSTLRDLLAGQKLVTAYPDEYLESIIDRMMSMNVAQIPIISRSDSRLVGYIDWKDLLQVRNKIQGEETQRVAFYRVG